jgi:valyl-tRNA synthetase
MKVGRRLAMKLLNASRFTLASATPIGPITYPVDRAMLRSLAVLVDEATRNFEAYDYARVLQRTEEFFWRFCDDYLELVKGRRYGEQGSSGAASANSSLVAALSVLLRLFAPFLPFVTEEVWSWWQEGSVHTAPWPVRDEIEALFPDHSESLRVADQHVYEWATEVLFEVRKQRSEARQPLKVPITLVTITTDATRAAMMPEVDADLRAALRVQRFECHTGDAHAVVVTGYDATPAA